MVLIWKRPPLEANKERKGDKEQRGEHMVQVEATWIRSLMPEIAPSPHGQKGPQKEEEKQRWCHIVGKEGKRKWRHTYLILEIWLVRADPRVSCLGPLLPQRSQERVPLISQKMGSVGRWEPGPASC